MSFSDVIVDSLIASSLFPWFEEVKYLRAKLLGFLSLLKMSQFRLPLLDSISAIFAVQFAC